MLPEKACCFIPAPSAMPSRRSSDNPSRAPSARPSRKPSAIPSATPSEFSTPEPTNLPTSAPVTTIVPTCPDGSVGPKFPGKCVRQFPSTGSKPKGCVNFCDVSPVFGCRQVCTVVGMAIVPGGCRQLCCPVPPTPTPTTLPSAAPSLRIVKVPTKRPTKRPQKKSRPTGKVCIVNFC